MRVTRRFMLCATAIAAGLSAAASGAMSPPRRGLTPAARRLGNLIPHGGSARAVGQLYLEKFPGEADAATLVRHILGTLSLSEADLAGEHNRSLRARLVAAVRADFAAERTVSIGGWILSRTEAQLCALWA